MTQTMPLFDVLYILAALVFGGVAGIALGLAIAARFVLR